MTRWRRTTACERAAQWMSLDLDGELGRLEQAALARHLRRCERCRAANSEIGTFTSFLREAPPIEPSRAVVVVTPAWAVKRRARAKIRGGILALAVATAGAFAVAVLPQSESTPPSSIGFSGTQQQEFARDHALSEPTLFVVAETSPPPSLAPRPLL